MLALIAAVALLNHQQDARLANAYRENRGGWVYAHLEGAPRDIGYQYGSLLAPEIDDAQKALHEVLKNQTGRDWNYFRDTAKKLFWDKVDVEYQQEMEGQAEGLQAKGFRYDAWDVLAMNSYIELSEYYIPWLSGRPATKTSCSALIATGSVTADGKIVVAQNFWWDYEMGERFTALLDIKPLHGHRIFMDALCGFIHSGSDFAVNDAGILVTETTLPTITDFDPEGTPEFVRMRKATQYSDSLDDFVKTMETGNNGGYANTWLIGDTKTNEIGELELGLKNVTFKRTKDGYFVGSNFPQNPKLIAEETTGWNPDPKSNGSEARRDRWNALVKANKGKIDAEMAKSFLADTVNQETGQKQASGSVLCGKEGLSGCNSARVITSEMAKNMQFWARMGVTDGTVLTFDHSDGGFLRDIPSQPWELFEIKNPDKK